MTTTPVNTTDWQRERRWLGYAGLLPFLACLAVMIAGSETWQASASGLLLSYAALIASFLGAVHWGVAGDGPDGRQLARLRWGVTPALVAWALLLLPQPFAFAGLTLLFVLILVVDRYLLPVLDDGYRQLRLRLSLIVVATLAVASGVTA